MLPIIHKNIILVFFFIISISGCRHIATDTKANKVCFKDSCFDVELAVTAAQHAQGLMFRKNLGQNQGMLFIFEKEGEHNFWMKNTFIPLDIIWINKDKRVVFIKENTQPCKQDSCFVFEPGQEAKYVLELNSGKASNIGIKQGEEAIFHL